MQALLFSDLLMPQWFAIPTRYVIWQQAFDLWRGSPLLGVGIGAFPALFLERVRDMPFFEFGNVHHAHNLVLQAALDVGAVGMLAYLALLCGAGVSALRSARLFGADPLAGSAYGLAAGVIAFCLYGVLDDVTLTARAAPLIWYVIALAAATAVLQPAPSARRG